MGEAQKKRKRVKSTENMPQTTDDTDDYMEEAENIQTRQMETPS